MTIDDGCTYVYSEVLVQKSFTHKFIALVDHFHYKEHFYMYVSEFLVE
jgi:hypothetical protein